MSSETTDTADALAEKTGAISVNGDGPKETSKSALKKAQKQQKFADEKAAKSAKNKGGPSKQTDKKAPGNMAVGVELKAINAKKESDFAGWYTEVVTKGDLLDYTDISGCYVLYPSCMRIWEAIQTYFDSRIKSIGVEPCYFPMFATKEQLEVEQDHVDGFAAEVAWVTKYGNSKLEKEIAIRPTSEVCSSRFSA